MWPGFGGVGRLVTFSTTRPRPLAAVWWVGHQPAERASRLAGATARPTYVAPACATAAPLVSPSRSFPSNRAGFSTVIWWMASSGTSRLVR